ncbi:DNA gyrase C-terminal beta-propeller domain-containing protein, partial [Propionibacterium acidifaciens]|uniref:MerR family transcriptional regulator n=1 Tax=Propionibacterium acidifaciens TaxID=556499 RepID=UPI00361EDB9C
MPPAQLVGIGRVVETLKTEFPDITISKIRFLETEGLVLPERAPSGYRKYSPADVDRLRYILRVQRDQYRSQHRGGKGIRGAQLRGDDVVEHFFVTTTHSWILFFTNLGRVYRTKGYELQEAGRDAKGQHLANLLEFQPDEHIAQVMDLKTYEDA